MLRLLVGALAWIAVTLASSGAQAERGGAAVSGASATASAAGLLAQADAPQSAP
jgi:hypothetical protein